MSTVPEMETLFELTPEKSAEEERNNFHRDLLSTDDTIKDSLDDDFFDLSDYADDEDFEDFVDEDNDFFDFSDYADDEDNDFFDLDDDESDYYDSFRNGVKMKKFVSYFEINGTPGMMAFSDKGVEIRSLDPNKGISNITAFSIIYCSKRVRQLLKAYKPDKSVQYSIVEHISGDKSITSFVKKQKVNKNICDFPVYDISEYNKYKRGWFYGISHSRYFFTIDALFIAKQCAYYYWAGLAPVNRKSLLRDLKKHSGFRYVRHLDILKCCVDFM